MPEALFLRLAQAEYNLAILNVVFTLKLANSPVSMKTTGGKNFLLPIMTAMPAKPTVYIELCRQTSSSVSLNTLVLRDGFTFTSLGGFSCGCQGCITQQSCMSMGRTCLRDDPVPFIAVSSTRLCFGSLTARYEWPCVQFNSPCQNEHGCFVLLEAQILGCGSYQAFPVGKCCLHTVWNIFIVKLLVQNTSLTDVKSFAVCRG